MRSLGLTGEDKTGMFMENTDYVNGVVGFS